MIRFEEDFDYLHFSDSQIKIISITKDTIILEIFDLIAMWDHPVCQDYGKGRIRGRIIFEGVSFSKREIAEYIGDPMNPEGEKCSTINDGEFSDLSSAPGNEYCFEGILLQPYGWIDWEVKAKSFVLEAEELYSVVVARQNNPGAES